MAGVCPIGPARGSPPEAEPQAASPALSNHAFCPPAGMSPAQKLESFFQHDLFSAPGGSHSPLLILL